MKQFLWFDTRKLRAEENRPTLLLALGFLLLGLTVLSALWLSILQNDAASWVRHSIEVQNKINTVGRDIVAAESAERGYLISNRPVYLDAYHDALTDLSTARSVLATATSDNPAQQAALTELNRNIDQKLDGMRRIIILADGNRLSDAVETMRVGDEQRDMNRIEAILDQMSATEGELLVERSAVSETRTIIARTVLVLSTLLVIALAMLAMRESRRRLLELEETNRRLREEASARSAAVDQVRQLQKMEAVGQLTGGIAHDFNNMLAIIMGGLELALRRLKDDGDEAVRRNLSRAMEGTERAAALTAQLLAFSRRQPLEPKMVEANKLVSATSELLRRTLGETIKIETVLAGGLWRLHADPDQIENGIVNLALNSRDAMPGGGKLTIETANCELDERYARENEEVEPGQYVMISVTDTGEGMTAETMQKAFEPFFTTKPVGRGTGLGLSQLFGFVKQSRGHVKIYSELGRGTTVKIYLPRYRGTGVAAPPPSIIDTSVPESAGELILVVEDDPNVRASSVEALTELGYAVIGAANGTDALGIIQNRDDIDLLFTDIVMPDMTGRALADQALLVRPAMRILYTTGYTRNAIVHNGVVDYGVAFIQKPFTVAALARKIRSVLDERRRSK